MKEFISIFQVVIAIILMVIILFQQRGTALGSAFGQEGGFYATRRGLQKTLFWTTVVLGALFIILALVNLIL